PSAPPANAVPPKEDAPTPGDRPEVTPTAPAGKDLPPPAEPAEPPAARPVAKREAAAPADPPVGPVEFLPAVPPALRPCAARVRNAYRPRSDEEPDPDPARRLLDDCPVVWRGWEWEYCRRLASRRTPSVSRKKSLRKAATGTGAGPEGGVTV